MALSYPGLSALNPHHYSSVRPYSGPCRCLRFSVRVQDQGWEAVSREVSGPQLPGRYDWTAGLRLSSSAAARQVCASPSGRVNAVRSPTSTS